MYRSRGPWKCSFEATTYFGVFSAVEQQPIVKLIKKGHKIEIEAWPMQRYKNPDTTPY